MGTRGGCRRVAAPETVWTLSLLLVAVLSGAAIGAHDYIREWTPLQRMYFPSYIRSQCVAALGIARGSYQLLYVVDRKGERPAINDDVRPATTVEGRVSFVLSDAALRAGAQRLVWVSGQRAHAAVHDFLQRWIYDNQTLANLATPALRGALVMLLVGLVVAIPNDLARARQRRHGRRLKGPELVSARTFNRRLRADGISFALVRRRLARAFGLSPSVRIPRRLESHHILIMGDTGTGKSSLIRQVLQQLDQRGETAIVYDPAREYTPQFYRPERGDVILNPLDARSPYWSPGDELQDEAEALTLAASLFPDRPNENPFFVEGPRRLFAHLLTFRPTAQQLVAWLGDEDELDRLLRGTPYAALVDRRAPPQRSGVLAALNMVADTLKLLPAETLGGARWSALAWARQRQGWIFLTSTPETRTRLVPLMSLWLDMLVLRLMTTGSKPHRPVWFILDELASLQRLPQLHTAVTENRKSNNPIVLGFQGRSQLETRYGHDAEAMLSQPATKIFLGTSEPRAAKWISETIGEIEVERLTESRSVGQRGQTSHGLERHVEPLVMASEISGLVPLRGYLKVHNYVVRLHVPFVQLPSIHPDVIPRPPRVDTVPTRAAASGHAPVAACRDAGDESDARPGASRTRAGALFPVAGNRHAHSFQAVERRASEALSRGRVPQYAGQLLQPGRSDRRPVARATRRAMGSEGRGGRGAVRAAGRRAASGDR